MELPEVWGFSGFCTSLGNNEETCQNVSYLNSYRVHGHKIYRDDKYHRILKIIKFGRNKSNTNICESSIEMENIEN